MNPELEAGPDLRQGFLGALAAGERIRDDPDMMSAVDLAVGEVKNVAEDSANRRAHNVQDTKRPVLVLVFIFILALGRGHDQNRRPSRRRPSRWRRRMTATAATRQNAAGAVSQQRKAAYAPRIGQSLKILDSD